MTVLVGGVGELYQGDHDLGRLAIERLAAEGPWPGVILEELYYGAIAVTQRLEDLQPEALVLVGAAARGRPPGSATRRRVRPGAPPVETLRRAVEEAGTGHVSIDLILEVASGFGALPGRTVVVEVEPASTGPSETLSAAGRAGLDEAVGLVRAEVRRLPLLGLADRLRTRIEGSPHERSPALAVMEELLGELDRLDREGRWGATFRLRDHLRLRIAAGETGDGMDSLDWSLWWGLIEELDRLQSIEGCGP